MTAFARRSVSGANMFGVDLRFAKMEHATLAGINAMKGFDAMAKKAVSKETKAKEPDLER